MYNRICPKILSLNVQFTTNLSTKTILPLIFCLQTIHTLSLCFWFITKPNCVGIYVSISAGISDEFTYIIEVFSISTYSIAYVLITVDSAIINFTADSYCFWNSNKKMAINVLLLVLSKLIVIRDATRWLVTVGFVQWGGRNSVDSAWH